jgi:F-type H+-transporting ATPase subunit gamma
LASLKEIKGRIASIRTTQKTTSAMRMVSSAKLHHVQGLTEAFLLYKENLESIVDKLGDISTQTSSDVATHSVLLVPISSNSGLCGAFNSNIAKSTLQRIKEWESQETKVSLLPIGKKIVNALKKAGIDFNGDFVNLLEAIEKKGTFTAVSPLVAYAEKLRQSKEIDSVEFIYHHFKSRGTQTITTTPLLLDMPQIQTKEDKEWLTEPSPEELLSSLFPRLQNAQVYSIMIDSLTSEHAARMLAMQTADDNANDMLKELTLLYNKTRQQSITNELIDMMGGKVGEHS